MQAQQPENLSSKEAPSKYALKPMQDYSACLILTATIKTG